MRDLDFFYRYRARLKNSEHLTLIERREYVALGRAWIALYKNFPQTADVKASIKTIQSDMRRVTKKRLKNRVAKTDPMKDVMR